MNFKKAWAIIKGTFTEFSEDNVLRLSAALAYYAIFSIGPLLAIVLGLAGLAFGHDTVHREIQQQLQSMVGENSAKTVDSMMAAQKHGASLLTTIVGLVALLFGAAGVFGQLQDSLNTIWEVKPKPGAGIGGLVRKRFISFSMVLGIGFLLLVSLALTTFLNAATASFANKLPLSDFLAHALNFVVSFGVISALFAMIFKYLPDVKIPFRKVWVGAIGTAFLFTIGKYLLALYLGRASTASAYGAAGSVILILMWVYYASIILLLGAEFTQVYATQTGPSLAPTQYAVPVTQEERSQQGIPGGEGARSPRPSPTFASSARLTSPGAVIRERPAQFLGMMLVAGFAGRLSFDFEPSATHFDFTAAFANRVLQSFLLLPVFWGITPLTVGRKCSIKNAEYPQEVAFIPGPDGLYYLMKKLLLLSAALIGFATASRAGVAFSFGFPLPSVTISPPGYYAAPAPYPAPYGYGYGYGPSVTIGAPYCGNGYGGYYGNPYYYGRGYYGNGYYGGNGFYRHGYYGYHNGGRYYHGGGGYHHGHHH